MNRKEAIENIKEILGKDLINLAKKHHVTIFKEGKKNKGWVGQVVERHLGLPINTAQAPNFGSWELKTISLKYLKSGELSIKETMAITMIDPINVVNTPFEKSHLLSKLKKILIVSRIWHNKEETESTLYGVHEFNLGKEEQYFTIRDDYELVRNSIINKGFESLTGKMGKYIQPRTKGKGHGSISRAFYARVSFLKQIVLFND